MSLSQEPRPPVRHVKRLPIDYLLRTYRDEILQLAKQHGITNVRIFGSVARGEAASTSDLDLLIDLDPDRSLLDRIGFMQDLEDLLGVPVHAVTEKGLHPLMRTSILSDARSL
jgi:uncharacterized protein